MKMEWKNDAPYVLCLSHDVDRVKKQWYHYCFYGLKHPVIQIKSLMRKFKGFEPYWNFDRIIDIESDYGVSSTFFFLNESHHELSPNFMGRYNIKDKKVTDIIKYLDSKGYEIGLHGSYYSYNDEKLLAGEKQTLEQIVGHPVISIRQHHLNLDKDKTLQIQKRIGLEYDSTYGLSEKVCHKQPLRTPEGMVEIPITLMDTVELTESVIRECFDIASKGGAIMLNFHQCHFNDIEYPKNTSAYKTLLDKAKKDGAWITDVRTLGEWLNYNMP